MHETKQGDGQRVSVIIPAFNEGETIATTVRDLRNLYPNYEVLVIDDGSEDRTALIAQRAGARVHRNHRNMGYGASLKQGLRKAHGDIIVFMDADGQHDSCEVADLVDHLEATDMVVGERSRDAITPARRPGKWVLGRVAEYLVGQPIPDINSGFRTFYRDEALPYLPILPNGFSLTTTQTLAMMRDGRDITYIPISVKPREGGRSTVRFVRDGTKTLLLILRVIMLFNPLKIFVPLSAILFTIGIFYTLVTLFQQTNITDIGLLLLLSSFGTFALGLLADQIANLRRGG